MNKKNIRMLALLLVIAAILSISAFAADTKASSYLTGYGATVVPTGNGNINIEFTVVGTGTMTKIGASVIQVYKSNGTRVATFSYTTSGYGNMMGWNTGMHFGSVSYAGTSGQSYYAIVTFYAKNSSGADTKTYTTAIVAA